MTETSQAATAAPEVIYVKDRRISCDGGGGPLGHPKVYYNLDDGEVRCGYCDRLFIYAPDKVAAAAS